MGGGGRLLVLADGWSLAAASAYLAANWVAPFGIVLVAGPLSALMLVLAASDRARLAVCSRRRAGTGRRRELPPLFQFLLMGLNGAFLTNDLFNLFVFIRGHAGGVLRARAAQLQPASHQAGMQYIAGVNPGGFAGVPDRGVADLRASGTLNIADLGACSQPCSARRTPGCLQVGAAVLALAFLTKGAMCPLGFGWPHHPRLGLGAGGGDAGADDQGGRVCRAAGVAGGVRRGAGAAGYFSFAALTLGGMATVLFGAYRHAIAAARRRA